jgi:hypothetical protein
MRLLMTLLLALGSPPILASDLPAQFVNPPVR